MNAWAKILRIASWLLFVFALLLPAIDNRFGELVAGYGTRGYQCFVGLFVVVLAVPVAAPLWIVLILGNVSTLLLPWASRLAGARPRLGRWWRWIAALAVLGTGTLAALGDAVGVLELRAGFFAWAVSLGLAALALWLPIGSARLSKRRLRRASHHFRTARRDS